MIVEPNKKKKVSSSFLKRTQPMKSHRLFVYYSPLNYLSPSMKVFSFPSFAGICMWFTIVADPKLQFSADSEETHLCWRNIWLSI